MPQIQMKRHNHFGFLRAEADAPKAQVKLARDGDGEATIEIYDVIGWPYLLATDVSAALREASNVELLHVRINSPGGDVWEARAIHTRLSEFARNALIQFHVDGFAASAATTIAMVPGAEVLMAEGAEWMIHNCWTIAVGNAADFEAYGKELRTTDDNLVRDYVAKTGQKEAAIREWMAKNTFFSSSEALAAGFVDRVVKPGEVEKAKALEAATLFNLRELRERGQGCDVGREARDGKLRMAANARRLRMVGV